MLRRLRLKFVLVMMVLATAVLLAGFGMVYHSTAVDLRSSSENMLRAVVLTPIRWGRTQGKCLQEAPCLKVQLNRRGEITVVEGAGSLETAEVRRLVDAAGAHGGDGGVLGEEAVRFCRLEFPQGERFAFADISSERDTLAHLAKRCILMALCGFGGFLALSLLLARWMVRPVEEAWQQQRQFVADASHELKTPLTVILTNAELLQRDGNPRSADVLTMARQMRRLVERLLVLAQAEGEAQPPMEILDWSGLAEEGSLPFEAVFFEAGLVLESRIQKGIQVKGREEQLRQLLPVLLDNARKYAQPGSRVTVTLERVGRQHCRLMVENAGEAIPGEELTNIFKRFYRMDKARSRDGSFGLGLPIAQEIVRGHKGRIWAESGDGVNRFFIELPCKAGQRGGA